MNYHIIIRDPDINNRKHKPLKPGKSWYVQDAISTNRDATPAGFKGIGIGDKVYLYETGYAIWAESIVLEKTDLFTLTSMEAIRDFILFNTNYDNSSYWGEQLISKIFPKMNSGDFRSYKVFEFKLDVKKLDNPIFLEKPVTQGSYRKLTGPPIPSTKNAKPDPRIPTTVRYTLFEKFKLHPESIHIIDVDHVVPKSVGGPGNIEENLIPISSSVNRTKGDKVPKALFNIAKKYQDLLGLKKEDFYYTNIAKKDMPDNVLGGEDVRQKAKKIATCINTLDFDVVKKIYNEIRFEYYPNAKYYY